MPFARYGGEYKDQHKQPISAEGPVRADINSGSEYITPKQLIYDHHLSVSSTRLKHALYTVI